jgi:hypothetical protein
MALAFEQDNKESTHVRRSFAENLSQVFSATAPQRHSATAPQRHSAKRQAPSAKRQAPSAKRQAPSAKRQAPAFLDRILTKTLVQMSMDWLSADSPPRGCFLDDFGPAVTR